MPPRSAQAVSSPVFSTPNHASPLPANSQLSPNDPRTSSTARPPLLHRSSSTPSPLLASALHPHEFVLPDTDLHLPLQSKHAGPGALRRIFIGPHIVGTAERKDRAREATEEDESSGTESEGLSESESGRRERVKKTIETRRPRLDRRTSGQSMGGPRVGGKKGVMHKWTGGSFEIGGDVREAVARRQEAARRREETTAALMASSVGRETFVTARTELDGSAKKVPSGDYRSEDSPARVEAALPELTHQLLRRPSDVASETASLCDLPTSPPPFKSILKSPTPLGNGHSTLVANGSATPNKTVQLPALDRSNTTPHLPISRIPLELLYPGPHSGDQPPPPVGDILARPVGDDFDEDVPIVFPPKAMHGRRAVLKKERMLIRAEWTAREDLPDSFDEHSARKFPTQSEGWEEFAVIWRPGRIELWSEYAIPATSLFVGHKKLKHIVPLHPSRTKLSLYSSPDTIFCLAHRPLSSSHASLDSTSHHDARAKKRHHFRPEGTNLYIICPRSSAIAKEWMWELYRELGGSIPSALDISVPGLGVKIRLPVPLDLPPSANELARSGYQAVEEGLGEGYRLLKPDAVVKACMEQMSEVQDWKQSIADNVKDGVEIRLAWRRGEVLDWIPAGDDGKDYAVVCGLALQQPNLETSLELRAALHYPTTVRLPSTPSSPSKRFSEPPSIEGYLTRLKPSGASERIYLSTHDGHLFLCRPSSARAPDPPKPIQEGINNPATLVLAPFVLGFASLGGSRKRKTKLWERLTGGKDARPREELWREKVEVDPMEGLLERLEKEERKRAQEQILAARGYVDLRSIVRVVSVEEGGEEEGVGGEEGMERAVDKVVLRRQRSFVMELNTGRSVQFECYSISVAAEWIGRLSALATYWSRRERVDAIEQMELQPLRRSSRGPRSHRDVDREDDDVTPLLGKMFHHCVLDECRSILRCGRFYVKRGLRGIFKERYIFLLPGGILLEYVGKQRNVHGQATQVVYHRRSGTLDLRGCYVYSGRLCSSVMGPNSSSGWDSADNQQRFPRIYSATDGLRTTDEDEDCTFVVWKKKAEHLRLGKAGNLRVFRARSKIERDEWVFALNSAIEKMQQGEWKAREDSLKEFAWLSRT